MSDGYMCPVRGTYNHVFTYRYFFAQERKTAFKLANEALFSISESLICFKFHISPKTFNILGQMVTCTISGTCHHEVGSPRFNSFKDTSLQNLDHRRTRDTCSVLGN